MSHTALAPSPELAPDETLIAPHGGVLKELYLPLAEATVVRLAGDGLVRGIRWVMTPDAAA